MTAGPGAPAAGPERPGGRYAFLASARWVRLIVVAVVVAAGCVALGYWQWTRHADRLESSERIGANLDAPPVPLAQLLPGPAAALPDELVWRPVTVTGTYPPGGTVVLRNRPVQGTPAVHVLAPLVVETADGSAAVLVVDRGWLPAEAVDDGGHVPLPPAGEVRVTARLRAIETADRRVAPPGQVYAVDPAAVLTAGEAPADVAALPVLDAYAAVVVEEPAPAEAVRPLPRPDATLGSHLSYAFQWWVFALGALVGVGVLARREARGGRGVAEPGRSEPQPPARTARSARRRPSAEDEEDALIDAQLGDAGRGWANQDGRSP